MAATAEARRLTEAHRLAQNRLGQQTVRLMAPAWRTIDPADLDRTVAAWLRTTTPLIRAQRATSARLAASYYTRFRQLEARTTGRFVAPVVESIPTERVLATLTATGPARVKAATGRGLTIAQADRLGFTGAAGAAQRLVLDAGRTTITTAIDADPQALGYARVASGDGCSFCLMLASRGPVYGEASADFEAHDRCSCGAEPVYSEDAPWPPGSREARDRWNEATQGLSGTDALNAFRRSLAAN